MDKGIATKAAFSVALTLLSTQLEILAPIIPVLAICLIMDYIAGMYSAAKRGEIKSRTAFEGAIRKLFYGVGVCVALIVDIVINLCANEFGIDFSYPIFGILVTVWLIMTEIISIIENIGEIGVPMPVFLEKAVKELRSTIEKKGNSDNG